MFFIKTKEEAKLKINEECNNLYKSKIEILEIYENLCFDDSKQKKKENEKFILNNEPIQQLRESYNYIINF